MRKIEFLDKIEKKDEYIDINDELIENENFSLKEIEKTLNMTVCGVIRQQDGSLDLLFKER